MIGFFKKSKDESTTPTVATDVSPSESASETQPEVSDKPKGFFSRLTQGLSKTSRAMTEGIASLVQGKRKVDDELLEELESRLLMADVGVEATQRILDGLTRHTNNRDISDADALFDALRQSMLEVLAPIEQPFVVRPTESGGPFVILVVGINGAGKTTTIGKLAKRLQLEGHSVMLAAGDTFRAAAVEQLKTWGERNQIPVIAQAKGSDSASVIYDALQSAQARGVDVLIADTAGRLHTQTNLMEEMKKVSRVITRHDETAPHEILLVLDAGTGQNALNQAREFNRTLDLSGFVVTKLDGTAKGGILFAIAEQLGIPVRFIGVGEGIDDLKPFLADEFVRALLESDVSS